MSSTVIDLSTSGPANKARLESKPITYGRAVKSEWIKFRSLRSSWAVLGAAVFGILVVGLVIAYNTRHLTANQDHADLTATAPLSGYHLGQLLIGALGVMFVSSEFATGMIRSTFAAVPKRLPVLCAKLTVFTLVSAIVMIPTCVVTFLVSQAVISQARPGYSLLASGVLRLVVSTGVYVVAVGVIGQLIAWCVRSTPGTLVSYYGLMLVVPLMLGLFGHTGQRLAQFTPSKAGDVLVSAAPESPHLSIGASVLTLVGWAVAGLVAALVTLRRRDA
jgi:ABC-2 type transport system permease protein